MKKILTTVALAVSTVTFTTDVQAEQSAMDQLKQTLAKMTSFQGKFEQVVKDEQGNVLQQGAGQITLAQPLKIRWQQEMPDETLFVSEGKTTYYYDAFAEQVTIMDTNKLIDTTPFVLLTTQDMTQWNKYQVTLNTTTYEITPNETVESQVEKLTLEFNKSGDSLAKLSVIDVSGQLSSFTFKNTKVNETISDTTFQFTVPEGVVVDDQTQSD
ncbi:outer membrane lipoprotein chaperone LolA [Pseudoalteromonas sp. T1lg65]|uniref:outer membrane lipoprotein chaperone LolA n=1 Tax=Pseudoalteromonas sp. T1lg65 TaxID=2077101 RepID=UPI003F790CA0